jgi:uncharacterized protein YkwD
MSAPTHPFKLWSRLAVITAVIVGMSGCLSPSQDKSMRAMNADRNRYNMRSLRLSGDSQRKAQAWAAKLAREGTLYHSSLTSGIGSRWCALGENVGMGPNTAAVQNAYMRSAGHRANILGNYKGVGVGVVRKGKTVWVVQEFIRNC